MKKNSVLKQVLSVLGTHIIISIAFLVIFMGLMSFAEKNPVLNVISTVIVCLIYFFIIFTNAYDCAASDLKSFSTLKPYALKGAVLSLGIVVLMTAAWIWHAVVWGISGGDVSTGTVAANLVCLVMSAPFSSMTNLKGADANLYGQLASVAIPLVSCMVGYFCGYRKWDYTRYLNRFVYEKKKK